MLTRLLTRFVFALCPHYRPVRRAIWRAGLRP